MASLKLNLDKGSFINLWTPAYLAAWLHLFNAVFIYSGGLSNVQLQLVVLLSAPCFVWLVVVGPKENRLNHLIVFYVVCFFALATISMYNEFNIAIFVRLMNLLYVNMLVYLFMMSVRQPLWKLFKYYALMGVPVLMYIYAVTTTVDYRGDLKVQPNYVGLCIVSIMLAAIVIEKFSIKLVIYTLGMLALINASSRTSMLCTLLIILYDAFIYSKFGFLGIKRLLPRLALLFGYLALGVIVMVPVLSDLFLLNDQYRGLDSGLSGRDTRWRLAIEQIMLHPFIGIGYGQSSQYLGFTTDNSYLTVALEIGIAGLILYMLTNSTAVWMALKNSHLHSFVYLIIYLIYGVFEKRHFSTGNSLSIMYFFCLYGAFLDPKPTRDTIR